MRDILNKRIEKHAFLRKMFVQDKVCFKFAPSFTQKCWSFGGLSPHFIEVLAHGVTGNTSGFGPEESRFEP